MIILNGASWERFVKYYNFKELDSVFLFIALAFVSFAICIILIHILRIDEDDEQLLIDKELQERPHPTEKRLATTTFSSQILASASQWLRLQSSPWVLCTLLANFLPFFFFVPLILRFSKSPSICAWHQLLPGPLDAILCIQGSNWVYNTIVATQLEGQFRKQERSNLGKGKKERTSLLNTIIIPSLIQYLGVYVTVSILIIYTIPRCIFDGHQTNVDIAMLISPIVVILIESRDPTMPGLFFLGVVIPSAWYVIYTFNSCDCTLYGVAEVVTMMCGNNWWAFRIARRKKFETLKYTLHVFAIAHVMWLVAQFQLNWCVAKGLSYDTGGSMRDGMMSRMKDTRTLYNPTLW